MMFSYRIFHGEKFKKLKRVRRSFNGGGRRVEMKNVMKNFIKKISTMALFVFVMSSSVFVASSTAVSVIGKYGISKQECGMGNGAYCMKWSRSKSHGAKTTPEVAMPLTPVAKNSDNTYTLVTDNIYIQYFVTDASGKSVGSGHLSTKFKDAKSWDGNSNIITYKSGKKYP